MGDRGYRLGRKTNLRIQKRLAVVAAAALPLAGLAALGGASPASAAAPPTLKCPVVEPDPANYGSGTSGTGGVTFDTSSSGANPGSGYLAIYAGAGGTAELTSSAGSGASEIAVSQLLIVGQTLTIAGVSGVFTDTGNAFNALDGPVGTGNPDTASFTPPLPVPVRAKTVVTVNPTTTEGNESSAVTFTSGSTTIASDGGIFASSMVGKPVVGSYDDNGAWNDALQGNPNAPVGPGNPPISVTAVLSSTEIEVSAPAVVSSAGVLTIGGQDVAPVETYADYDFQLNDCTASLAEPGLLSPVVGMLTGTSEGPVGSNLPKGAGVVASNDAAALEDPPVNWVGFWKPPPVPTGCPQCSWGDDGGWNTALNGGDGAANPVAPSNISFTTTKDNTLLLDQNAYEFGDGAVTGDFATTKASLGLAGDGAVTCTVGQLQAITEGTGIDSSSIATGSSPLQVCDGGTDSSVTPAAALSNLINLELNPSATVYGSDGTVIAGVWEIAADANGSAVI